MKVVLDTNVVVSGLFFGGVPGQVLSAWNAGRLALVLSASILAEYREVGSELSEKNSALDFESFAALLVMNSEVVDAPQYLESQVCSDPEDDKFLSCAAVSGAQIIVSGDRQLLAVSGWNEISVVRPRDFVERYLTTAE
ncbi:MAG: putative toxin-antitoxin system toxin component, PIN family [Longimicrobiales bacterium]